MKALKIAALVVLVYLGIVAAFESLIGYFQPTAGSILTTSICRARASWQPVNWRSPAGWHRP